MVNMLSKTEGLSLDNWASSSVASHSRLNQKRLRKAAEFLAGLKADDNLGSTGIELATLLGELELDTSSLICGLTYRFARSGKLSIGEVRRRLGGDVAHLTEEILRMANIGLLEFSNAPVLSSVSRSQVANVRNMLVALIDDPRVAVIKLAERVVALRHAKNASVARKLRIAQESENFFAPLANRLGVWQLKWELEDLSLRYLEPETYSTIARQLAGRREEREKRIQSVVEQLQTMFEHFSAGSGQGLRSPGETQSVNRKASEDGVQIAGRAKHIYSIWRKMRRKEISFSEVHDVNAVRILVPSPADCYQALGIVHTRWHHIPREFDDYIANPKDNGYRAIHTAVNLEDGRVLEIQIKTYEMHRESELGVCAHWAYKDDSDTDSEDVFYKEKVNWLRNVLTWSEESGNFSSFREELRANIEQDRIYVYTPKGHVLDLTLGATPVDFAYRVHTEVGNHCHAAKVDGIPTALNSTLLTGQCVEILVADDVTPDRNWLNPTLGYIRTVRARAKVQSWFKKLDSQSNIQAGDNLLTDTARSLGILIDRERLLVSFGFDSWEELLYAVGLGELNVLDVVRLCDPEEANRKQLTLLGSNQESDDVPQREKKAEFSSQTDSSEPIRTRESESQQETIFFLSIDSVDRSNLLRDITELIAQQNFEMQSIIAHSDRKTGRVRFELSVTAPDIVALARLLGNIRHLNGVIDAVRLNQPELGRRQTGVHSEEN